MYVCSCHGITKTHIEAEVSAGARCTRDIGARCRAGTDCGGCVRNISAIVRTARTQYDALALETAV